MNKKGQAYILTCSIVMSVAILLVALFQYFTVMRTVNRSREYVSEKLDLYITDTTINRYSAFRLGKAYNSGFNTAELILGAYAVFGITGEEEKVAILSKNGMETLCTLTDMVITRTSGEQVGVTAAYTLVIPMNFLGDTFSDIKVELAVSSRYVRIGQ